MDDATSGEEPRSEESPSLPSENRPRRGRRLWRWFLLAAGLVLLGVMLRKVLFPFQGQSYLEIGHGDHTHYVPKDRNETVPVSSFPMVEPGPGERVTPDGDIVPEQ